MKFYWLMSFPLVMDLLLFAESAPPDFFEKNWLDRCDIKGLKSSVEGPTTHKTTTTMRPLPGIIPGGKQPHKETSRKVNKYPVINVAAKFETLVKELKNKLTMDAYERGASPELGVPVAQERGIESVIYQEMYDEYGDYGNSGHKRHINYGTKRNGNDYLDSLPDYEGEFVTYPDANKSKKPIIDLEPNAEFLHLSRRKHS